MHDFLQSLDSKCVINQGAIFAVPQGPGKSTSICKCLIASVSEGVLHFPSAALGGSESHNHLEDLLGRSLDENVGEDSVLVSKRYREGVVG